MGIAHRSRVAFYWAFVTLALTTAWVVLMLAARSEMGAIASWDQIRIYLWNGGSGPHTMHYASYLNALALTVSNTVLFWVLMGGLANSRRFFLAVVVAYGVLNVLSYGLQLTAVPWLIRRADDYRWAEPCLRQLVHVYPPSAVALANGLAYALLGVPAWRFGQACLAVAGACRMAGALLIANSLACWLGLLGMIVGSTSLAAGVMVGGGLFWLALFPLTWVLYHSPDSSL